MDMRHCKHKSIHLYPATPNMILDFDIMLLLIRYLIANAVNGFFYDREDVECYRNLPLLKISYRWRDVYHLKY